MNTQFEYQADYIKFLEDIGFTFSEACYFVKEAMKKRLHKHISLVNKFVECCDDNGLDYDECLRKFVEISPHTIHSEFYLQFL